MNVLSEKIVRTKKKHNCFACGRLFEMGTPMKRQVCTDGHCIWSAYSCETCQTLLSDFENIFIDGWEFPPNCVDDLCGNSKSPEDLLEELKTTAKNNCE